MTKDTKITGVKFVIELDNDGEWHDLTEFLDDEAIESIEKLLDNIEDSMNEGIQLQKCGGLH